MNRTRLFLLSTAVLFLSAATASAGPIGYSVSAHNNGKLYRIDLGTGVATLVGDIIPEIGDDAEGLAFIGSTLYAITGGTISDSLWDITSLPGTKIGDTGLRTGNNAGMDSYNGTLYNVQGDASLGSFLYSVNPATGAATLVGTGVGGGAPKDMQGVAIDSNGNAFAADATQTDSLYPFNLTTGVFGAARPFGVSTNFAAGLAFDSSDTLWMTNDFSQIWTIDPLTGAATYQRDILLNGTPGLKVFGLSGLAINDVAVVVNPLGNGDAIPEPATLILVGAGLVLAARRIAAARSRRV